MAKMATVIIVKGTEPVNSVCLDRATASEWLAQYDGTTVVSDPQDDFGTEFITLTGCIAIDVTGLDPMPGVGNGWTYVNNEWVAPKIKETTVDETQ
jgi:hypothetical protein